MKKGLVLAVAMLLLSSMVFAGGLYISADASFSLPMKGWDSEDIQNGFSDSAIEDKFLGGLSGEVGLGYEFNDVFRMGLRGGFGFNQTKGDHDIYTVPVVLDLNCKLFSLGSVDFRTGLSLGGYGRIYNKVLYLGPMAALELGAEVRLTEHLIFGFNSELSTFIELYNDFNGMTIEIDYIPVSMTMKYVI